MTSNPRRPSYASVASGTAAMNAARMNTLAAFGHSNQSSTSIPTQQATGQPSTRPPSAHHPSAQQASRELRREPSRGSLRSMEIDGQGGSGGIWKHSRGGVEDGTGRMGCTLHEEHLPFFTPSYLRRSRHVDRLRRSWEEHVQTLREDAANQPPPSLPMAPSKPSLSARSSNTNLGKLHNSHHRMGVVQDVIERIPPPTEEDRSHPLPSKWNDEDRMSGLEILGSEGSEIRFNGVAKGDHEAASVRADHPMPKEVGMYYYEVTVLSRGKEGWIGIGFSGKRVSLNRLPGWETDSWAYHGDDGYSFACTASGKAYGPRYAAYDVVGCGVNFRTGEAFFTKNGVYLGVAFSGIKASNLYPSVGVRKPGEHLRANFGRTPFVFDIERMMDEERKTIMSDIRGTDLSHLRSGHGTDEKGLIQALVGQYLAHEGYVETAKAFSGDRMAELQALAGHPIGLREQPEEDVHAFNRQKIRRAILDGDIDKALKYTNSFYPHVLEEEGNRDILFRLRCRKFIEMMRRYTELAAVSGEGSGGSNGHHETAIEDEDDEEEDEDEDEGEAEGQAPQPIDTQMELDDQLHREASAPATFLKHPRPPTDDIDMTSSTEQLPATSKATAMKQSDLLNAALAYGQELQRTFGNDPRASTKKTLSDIFAIMAYTNPEGSVVGGLMREGERVGIAEGVNGAILVSLGKPSHAALEKACSQTEWILDEVAGKTGGAAAFVNVRKDFLGHGA